MDTLGFGVQGFELARQLKQLFFFHWTNADAFFLFALFAKVNHSVGVSHHILTLMFCLRDEINSYLAKSRFAALPNEKDRQRWELPALANQSMLMLLLDMQLDFNSPCAKLYERGRIRAGQNLRGSSLSRTLLQSPFTTRADLYL